jgi:hypothetical protein
MRYAVFTNLAFGGCLAISLVAQAQGPVAYPKAIQPDSITVAFSGRLSTLCRLKPDADPATQSREVAARDLKIAAVEAGGTTIHLDWSRSQKIHNELILSSVDFGDGGPNSGVQATVTGRMVFKPSKEVAYRVTPAGVTDDAPVPVVIVESLKIQFIGSDGKPRGPERKLVTAD